MGRILLATQTYRRWLIPRSVYPSLINAKVPIAIYIVVNLLYYYPTLFVSSRTKSYNNIKFVRNEIIENKSFNVICRCYSYHHDFLNFITCVLNTLSARYYHVPYLQSFIE